MVSAQPLDDADDLLHRPGDELLHLLGGGIRQLGLDREGRVGDVGEQLEGELDRADEAEDHSGQGEHPHRDGPREEARQKAGRPLLDDGGVEDRSLLPGHGSVVRSHRA